MNKKKLQVFRLDMLWTGASVMVRNKKGTWVAEVPCTPELYEMFNGKDKIYVLASINKEQRLCIENKVSDRSW